ncbi:hypothetical protein KC19_11G034200 [Ceratodon purpureus]|uniref:Uncharacterized protein n=1 Tax=Ceratodon purpureus TaxID=3225 RepID=A0A8T0GDM7_CERPU|nr:hypothetical protein KC19_11G034200 [Ceratodon purpureus]
MHRAWKVILEWSNQQVFILGSELQASPIWCHTHSLKTLNVSCFHARVRAALSIFSDCQI